jgi:hypothetical protein
MYLACLQGLYEWRVVRSDRVIGQTNTPAKKALQSIIIVNIMLIVLIIKSIFKINEREGARLKGNRLRPSPERRTP